MWRLGNNGQPPQLRGYRSGPVWLSTKRRSAAAQPLSAQQEPADGGSAHLHLHGHVPACRAALPARRRASGEHRVVLEGVASLSARFTEVGAGATEKGVRRRTPEHRIGRGLAEFRAVLQQRHELRRRAQLRLSHHMASARQTAPMRGDAERDTIIHRHPITIGRRGLRGGGHGGCGPGEGKAGQKFSAVAQLHLRSAMFEGLMPGCPSDGSLWCR